MPVLAFVLEASSLQLTASMSAVEDEPIVNSGRRKSFICQQSQVTGSGNLGPHTCTKRLVCAQSLVPLAKTTDRAWNVCVAWGRHNTQVRERIRALRGNWVSPRFPQCSPMKDQIKTTGADSLGS